MLRKLSIVLACLVTVMPCFAQTRALTADDYSRAEKFMGYNTNPLVLHSGVRPTWLPDDRFWYRTTTQNGTAFFVVDPATGARSTCELAECTERNAEAATRRRRAPPPNEPTPDGTQTVFIRDCNL